MNWFLTRHHVALPWTWRSALGRVSRRRRDKMMIRLAPWPQHPPFSRCVRGKDLGTQLGAMFFFNPSGFKLSSVFVHHYEVASRGCICSCSIDCFHWLNRVLYPFYCGHSYGSNEFLFQNLEVLFPWSPCMGHEVSVDWRSIVAYYYPRQEFGKFINFSYSVRWCLASSRSNRESEDLKSLR